MMPDRFCTHDFCLCTVSRINKTISFLNHFAKNNPDFQADCHNMVTDLTIAKDYLGIYSYLLEKTENAYIENDDTKVSLFPYEL